MVEILPGPEACPATAYVRSLLPSGRRSAQSRLSSVAEHFGYTFETFPWRELTPARVEAVRAWLRESGASPSSANSTLSALRSVACRSQRFGQIKAEACAAICLVEGVGGRSLPAGRALSRGEIEALLLACASDPTPSGARDFCLVALLYYGGLRREEACGLTLKDYDVRRHLFRVRGKGAREELVWLEQPEARTAVRRWLRRRVKVGGPLLYSLWSDGRARGSRRGESLRPLTGDAVYKILRRRSQEAGVRPEASPHDLRRSAITHLLEGGADALAVQDFARHVNISSTTIYDRRKERAKRQAGRLLSMSLSLQIPRPRRRPGRRRHRKRPRSVGQIG